MKAKDWTDEDVAKLRELAGAGRRDSEIAEALGRTDEGVKMQRKRHGIKSSWGRGGYWVGEGPAPAGARNGVKKELEVTLREVAPRKTKPARREMGKKERAARDRNLARKRRGKEARLRRESAAVERRIAPATVLDLLPATLDALAKDPGTGPLVLALARDAERASLARALLVALAVRPEGDVAALVGAARECVP